MNLPNMCLYFPYTLSMSRGIASCMRECLKVLIELLLGFTFNIKLKLMLRIHRVFRISFMITIGIQSFLFLQWQISRLVMEN